MTPMTGGSDRYRVSLTVGLADFQHNLLAILRPQLNRQDACGDRIDLQDAVIAPHEPSGDMTVKLHYERWACIKALGKKVEKRLVAGNATVAVKLTPLIESPDAVRLSAKLGAIDADGSLGELLHSGSLGEILREKITRSIQSSLDKATNWNATLPPALQSLLTLRTAAFQDAGSGRLQLAVNGEVRIPAAQLEALKSAATGQRP